jgi:osmotically-inducible protein OsmY
MPRIGLRSGTSGPAVVPHRDRHHFENITVTTRAAVVILSGTVRSWAERREAERVAWLAPGVTEVEHRIRLES